MKAGPRPIRVLLSLLIGWCFCIQLFSFTAQARQGHAEENGSESRRPSRVHREELELSIRSSRESEFRTVLRIRSRQWSEWLKKLSPAELSEDGPPYSVVELTVRRSEGITVYRLGEDQQLITGEGDERAAFRVPDKMAQALDNFSKGLREAHYGKAVEWTQANRLIPKGSIMRITDLETGLSFQGQRRAGSAHADVQPLTKQDTALMKQIYGGVWSWNRKAVLVETEEGIFGGSMHGMPHGGDGIPDNSFSGHFCIHFKGSTTHGSGLSDLAHQAMIHKATGNLETYHTGLTPLEVVDLFLIASNQKDRHLHALLTGGDSPSREALSREWLDPSLQSSRRISEDKESAAPLKEACQTALRTRVALWRKGARPQAVWLQWTLTRPDSSGAWVITDVRPEEKVLNSLF